MWVKRNKTSWIETVVLGGFALPHIWLRTGIVTAISIVMTILWTVVPAFHFSISTTPFTLIGLPLGIFLGFRNNTAYDRFWEARKLWGALVNTSRSLTRQMLTLIEVQPDATDRDFAEVRKFEIEVVHMVIAFVHALRHHLRNTSPHEVMTHLIPEADATKLRDKDNVPLGLLQMLGERLVVARRKKWIHAFHIPVIEGSLTQLTDIQGACERIKSTPIPYSYTVLLHRIVAVYCALLPFCLMDQIKWATPAVVFAVSYCFFGLDAVGDEIEQPFGTDINDLPLKSISRNIERNLRELLGEKDLPDPVAPKKGILV